MHQKFVTDGVVLGKRGVGESHTLTYILTREMGLVRARAQSARAERSKLRFGLEPLSVGRFCLVKGRAEWRLTGAEALSRPLLAAGVPAGRRAAAGRVAKLLTRLIQGQEHSPALYADVSEGFACLAQVHTDGAAESVECVLVLRILAHLGYLPHAQELKPFLERDLFALALEDEVAASRALLVRTINDSLQASGL